MPSMLTRRHDLRRAISRHSDLLLAALVVGIVAMMIVPLPTPLLDLLLSTNIAFAVVLLLVAIYVSDALRIAAFPSILLITTLFRLGLNVSSTRLILLQADAGQVIASFGDFVVAGNLVVGAVVFLILTIIQFVVIAKGSERVAEVAARFTLDAMPGKQMAIDADLRGGAIDLDQARSQRATLQRESQLYGSMDGAMKFVKGDAIAAILITVINIVGGLLIGVMMRQMRIGEAVTLYSLLTIGDGLVSQIPALLISIAAGIVVTRVASEDEGSHLGRDIGQQILAHPRAIAVAAALLFGLALVPGLPTGPFLLLAGAAAAVAFALGRASRTDPTRPGEPTTEEPREREPQPPNIIGIEVGEGLAARLSETGEGTRLLQALIPDVRERLHAELGIGLPGVQVRASAELEPQGYRVLLSEVPIASGAIDPAVGIVLAGHARLAELGVTDGEELALPGVVGPAVALPTATAAALAERGVALLDVPTRLALHLANALQGCAAELIGIQETQELLDALERTHSTLVHEVVPRQVSLQTLAEVLRRLVDEGVSVRNLREVLQALAEWGPVEKDPAVLAEHVRTALRRYLSYRYAGEAAALRAFLLDPMIEQAIAESIQRSDKGSYLALEPELGNDIVRAVAEHVERLPPDEPPPVVLTNLEIRRYVRRLLEVDFPGLAVLSYNELQPSVAVRPVARIAVT